jgi:hypothetical protein
LPYVRRRCSRFESPERDSKRGRKLSTNDLDLDFPFFVVYRLNAEPKKKKRKKK